MRFFCVSIFLVLFLSKTFAQRECVTTSYPQNSRLLPTPDQVDHFLKTIKKRNAKISDTLIYEIPIVVHVIHNSKDNFIGGVNNRNISDEQIHSQIAVLNEDFRKKAGTHGFNTNPAGADTRIQFCLAQYDPDGKSTTGIIRVYNKKLSFDYELDDVELKNLSYWPSDQYLNIWVTNIAGKILGYAQLPGGSGIPGAPFNDGSEFTDGVVIDYKAFGTLGSAGKPYNLGRTATHEVGHWLGLVHIWGDRYCGDDFVSDTPTQEWHADSTETLCDVRYTECSGVRIPKMYENYLDYTVDKCMNIFTQGQKERMRTFLEVSPRRKKLLESGGCCSNPLQPFTQNLNFESGRMLSEGWSIDNPDASNTWDLAFPGAFEKSNRCISISNKKSFHLNPKSYDVLISPSLDFSDNAHPNLYFDIAGAANNSNETDSLVIEFSLGCIDKKYWLKTIYGSDLNTARKANDNFYPESGDWSSVNIPLDAVANQRSVKLYITSYGTAGNSVFMDNIKIYKASPSLIINTYPNPATDKVSVDVLMDGENDVRFDLYNTLGQNVLSFNQFEKVSFSQDINLADLMNGIYILTVSTDNQVVSKKILVSK